MRIGTLQEVGEIAHKVLTSERLHEPDADDDFGPSQVNSPEAISIGEALLRPLLKLVGVFDHSYGLVRVEARVVWRC